VPTFQINLETRNGDSAEQGGSNVRDKVLTGKIAKKIQRVERKTSNRDQAEGKGGEPFRLKGGEEDVRRVVRMLPKHRSVQEKTYGAKGGQDKIRRGVISQERGEREQGGCTMGDE